MLTIRKLKKIAKQAKKFGDNPRIIKLATEQQILNAILEFLNRSGHFAWRNNTGGVYKTHGEHTRFFRFGHPGSADILGIQYFSGKFIAIEVKRPGKEPTELQKNFLNIIKSQGGIAFVAHSIDDVINYFQKGSEK